MVQVKDEKFEYTIKINTTSNVVTLIGKIHAIIEIKGKIIEYDGYEEQRIGFIENVKKEDIKEKENEIANQLHKKLDKFTRGLEEIEQLGLEIDIY